MGNSHQRRIERRARIRSAPISTEKEAAMSEKPTKPKPESSGEIRKSKITARLLEVIAVVASILGVATGILSFYPRLAVSDPIQMDTSDFFSYKITVTNDGLLPVYGASWMLALRSLKIHAQPGSEITTLLPHCAEWKATAELMEKIHESSEQHAAITAFPGSLLIDEGEPDYRFRLSRADNAIGSLSPGSGFTFTTEGLIGAGPGSAYDNADFAIAIQYTPVFPPIPMQTCSNFKSYRDRQGSQHWFRTGNQCDRFPWVHQKTVATRSGTNALT
jgi:hypothetical protein